MQAPSPWQGCDPWRGFQLLGNNKSFFFSFHEITSVNLSPSFSSPWFCLLSCTWIIVVLLLLLSSAFLPFANCVCFLLLMRHASSLWLLIDLVQNPLRVYLPLSGSFSFDLIMLFFLFLISINLQMMFFEIFISNLHVAVFDRNKI